MHSTYVHTHLLHNTSYIIYNIYKLFITGRSAPPLTIACPLRSPVRDLESPQEFRRGEANVRGLIRGVLLVRGGAVRALLATYARRLCASKFSGNPRCSLFGGWGLPERNVFGRWHR